MSNFGHLLRVKIETNKLLFLDVAKSAGVSAGFISQICTGRQKSVSREVVEKILNAFPNPQDLAELAEAYLNDELPKQAKELIQISPLMAREKPTEYRVPRLDSDFENAVNRIRLAVPSNEDLRLCVIDIANACCPKTETPRTIILHPDHTQAPEHQGQKGRKKRGVLDPDEIN